jgi:hypothetical protein
VKLGWVFAAIVLTATLAAGLYYRSHQAKPATALTAAVKTEIQLWDSLNLL